MPRAEEGSTVQNRFLKLFQVKIDYRRDVERDELRDHESAHDYQTKWTAGRTIGAKAKRDGHRAKNRSQGRHQNRPETVHAGIMNRAVGGFAGVDTLPRKVDNHDAILLHDSHQHEHAVGKVDKTVSGCT